ncbi:unnamed protein product, partial [Amoebophrya sp. A25]
HINVKKDSSVSHQRERDTINGSCNILCPGRLVSDSGGAVAQDAFVLRRIPPLPRTTPERRRQREESSASAASTSELVLPFRSSVDEFEEREEAPAVGERPEVEVEDNYELGIVLDDTTFRNDWQTRRQLKVWWFAAAELSRVDLEILIYQEDTIGPRGNIKSKYLAHHWKDTSSLFFVAAPSCGGGTISSSGTTSSSSITGNNLQSSASTTTSISRNGIQLPSDPIFYSDSYANFVTSTPTPTTQTPVQRHGLKDNYVLKIPALVSSYEMRLAITAIRRLQTQRAREREEQQFRNHVLQIAAAVSLSSDEEKSQKRALYNYFKNNVGYEGGRTEVEAISVSEFFTDLCHSDTSCFVGGSSAFPISSSNAISTFTTTSCRPRRA